MGSVFLQNPSVLESVAVEGLGGESSLNSTSSMKLACPITMSLLNWLVDLTSGNIKKEKKTENGFKNTPKSLMTSLLLW